MVRDGVAASLRTQFGSCSDLSRRIIIGSPGEMVPECAPPVVQPRPGGQVFRSCSSGRE